MIILGHELIEYKPYYHVRMQEDLSFLNKHDSVLCDFDVEMIKLCQEKKLNFGVYVQDEKQALIANGAGASVILSDVGVAKHIQQIAEYYLFDAKVGIRSDDINEALSLKVDMIFLDGSIKEIIR